MADKPDSKTTQIKDANAVVVVTPAKVELGAEAAKALKQAEGGSESQNGGKGDAVNADAESRKVTQHSLVLDSGSLDYEATTGTITLSEEQGKAKAKIFYTAYTKKRPEGEDFDPRQRPLTFSFNGGPGSSSVWLHMGAFGPRRVPMPDDASASAPPYEIIDNLHTILDLTDLVFIDPVSTGYSRAQPGEDPKQYHGVTPDVESVGEFIRLYTSREERWLSPKYLAGESYGTTRAANLALHMQQRHGMFFSGLVLVSSVLHLNTILFNTEHDLPYILYVPAYAATAWYHGQLDDALQGDGSPEALRALLDRAEAFALGDFARAMLLGDRLSEDERQAVAEELARLTGVSLDYVLRSNLRMRLSRFWKELRRDDGRIVGRLDSRYVGMDRDGSGGDFEYDPSMPVIMGPYSGTFNHYVRSELGFESDLPYEILTHKVHPWDFDTAQNRYLDVAEPMRQAMTQNPHLKVFVANGLYDLATPYFATEHTFHHMGLDPSLRGNVSMGYYPAGHMMYVHEPSLAQLKADLETFYTGG